MGSQQLRVMVATSSYWLVGNMPSTGVRIQDVLKDGGTDFVMLSDVQVHQHVERKCLTTLSDVVVPKCKIGIMVVPSDQHEAPVKRWNNFTAKAAVKVFTIVSEYCIQGELQLPTPSDDSLYTLTDKLGRFFAISRASISGPGAKQLNVPLLFANKEFVNCFHLAPLVHPVTEQSGNF